MQGFVDKQSLCQLRVFNGKIRYHTLHTPSTPNVLNYQVIVTPVLRLEKMIRVEAKVVQAEE